jgi:beta-lactamase class D
MMSLLVRYGLLSVFLMNLEACAIARSPYRKPTAVVSEQRKWSVSPLHFEKLDGCLIIYNLKTKKIEKLVGEQQCRKRVAPCSTFKVPLSVIAFDTEVIKDENTLLKWDGVDHGIPSWNRDHTATGWMRESVVWYSQELTPKIGADRLQDYLKKFHYGTHDISGGLTTAWLTQAPFIDGKPKNTLLINAHEQLDFMKKLWTNTLPASQRAIDLTKKLTFIETSPKGAIINGKTGSGFFKSPRFRLGWFIAHIQQGEEEFISVLTFTDKEEYQKSLFSGLQAKEITKDILAENGIW